MMTCWLDGIEIERREKNRERYRRGKGKVVEHTEKRGGKKAVCFVGRRNNDHTSFFCARTLTTNTHKYLSSCQHHYLKMDPTLSSDDEIFPSKIVVKNVSFEHGEDAGEELDKTKEGTRLRWSMFALSAIMMW